MREHLVERLGHRVGAAGVDAMLAERRIVGSAGPITQDTAYEPGTYLWFHRELPVEAPVPFPIGIVHRDEHLVVVDKPHFLATIPRGRHVVETALVRLRHDLGLPDLSPAHRLDRATAGLLMFVVQRGHRGAYQTLFRDRGVTQDLRGDRALRPGARAAAHGAQPDRQGARRDPRLRDRRAAQRRDPRRAAGAPGRARPLPPAPATGRTHQLRLHMSGLGVPILGDDLYPDIRERALDDYRAPCSCSPRRSRSPIRSAMRHTVSVSAAAFGLVRGGRSAFGPVDPRSARVRRNVVRC